MSRRSQEEFDADNKQLQMNLIAQGMNQAQVDLLSAAAASNELQIPNLDTGSPLTTSATLPLSVVGAPPGVFRDRAVVQPLVSELYRRARQLEGVVPFLLLHNARTAEEKKMLELTRNNLINGSAAKFHLFPVEVNSDGTSVLSGLSTKQLSLLPIACVYFSRLPESVPRIIVERLKCVLPIMRGIVDNASEIARLQKQKADGAAEEAEQFMANLDQIPVAMKRFLNNMIIGDQITRTSTLGNLDDEMWRVTKGRLMEKAAWRSLDKTKQKTDLQILFDAAVQPLLVDEGQMLTLINQSRGPRKDPVVSHDGATTTYDTSISFHDLYNLAFMDTVNSNVNAAKTGTAYGSLALYFCSYVKRLQPSSSSESKGDLDSPGKIMVDIMKLPPVEFEFDPVAHSMDDLLNGQLTANCVIVQTISARLTHGVLRPGAPQFDITSKEKLPLLRHVEYAFINGVLPIPDAEVLHASQLDSDRRRIIAAASAEVKLHEDDVINRGGVGGVRRNRNIPLNRQFVNPAIRQDDAKRLEEASDYLENNDVIRPFNARRHAAYTKLLYELETTLNSVVTFADTKRKNRAKLDMAKIVLESNDQGLKNAAKADPNLLVYLSELMGNAPLKSMYSQGAPVPKPLRVDPKFSRLDDPSRPKKKSSSDRDLVYLTDKINTGNLQVYDMFGKSRLKALLLAFKQYNQGVPSSSASSAPAST